MNAMKFLRIMWARKWIVLILFVLTAAGGSAYVLTQPKQFAAEASLVVEVRADPVLGALAPGLASAGYMATQIEILKSDRVAGRVVKMLGVERSPAAIAQWREETDAKIPLDRYFAGLLQRGLVAEPARGSSVISITFVSPDAAFASAAANAFAQAYMDVSVELRIEPAKQSAAWLDEQTKTLRVNLARAQAALSKYQQEKGIVVSDERLDLETARLNSLSAELAMAQAASVDASARQRYTGSENSPDIQQSGAVQILKGQLAAAEAKLVEVSGVVGVNHPQRLQLDAQVATLKQQLAAEMRRVSGGTEVSSRSSSQKVGELRGLVEAQKRLLLSMRSERDQITVLVREVDTAQRAFEQANQRVGQLNLEGQNTMANVRILSPAVEPVYPTRNKQVVGVLGSIAGGLLLGALAALGLEALHRRVREPEDLLVMAGVPVIGVLRPVGSKRPIFRKLVSGLPPPAYGAPGPGGRG